MKLVMLVAFLLVVVAFGIGVVTPSAPEQEYRIGDESPSSDLKGTHKYDYQSYYENTASSNGDLLDREDDFPETEERKQGQEGDEGKRKESESSREGRKAAKRRKQNQRKQRRGCISRSNSTRTGLCLGRRGCVKKNGIVTGRCGQRGLVCCMMEKSCSHSTTRNNTIFVNNGYPSADSGTRACTLTINRYNDNICQMRFDFITLELSQPDPDGNCVKDFLTVTGGTSASPIICGSNTGQHMYVDVDPQGGAVRLTVDRTTASLSERMWKVVVSQIECTSKYKAPSGCLQYFTETSGTVSSFNFDQQVDEEFVPQTTRQIVDMKYAVCVQTSDGYCSIMWTRNITAGDYGFTMSSNIAGLAKNLVGDPASSSTSDSCLTDYVVIPGAFDDLERQNDRFCGAGFPNSVTSNFRPFIMYVTTDNNEQGDILNRGFCLDYRQMIC